MRVTTRKLYDRILDRAPEKVKVQLDCLKSYDNLRTALTKLNRVARDLLDAGSLCSEWNEDTGIAAFWVGEKRRKENLFEILGDDDGAPVSGTVEVHPGSQLGAGAEEDPGTSIESPTNFASDSEREIDRESQTGSASGTAEAWSVEI